MKNISIEQKAWLANNESLRMDAKSPLFLDFGATMLRQLADQFFSRVSYFYQNPDSNRKFPRIGTLQSEDPNDAQCITVVCECPRKNSSAKDRSEMMMEQIYRNGFAIHQEYLTLSYRKNTPFIQRLMGRLLQRTKT